MRTLVALLGSLAFSACAAETIAQEARMPLEILRAEGEAPRMGAVMMVVGDYSQASPYVFRIWFKSEQGTLGEPEMVQWGVNLADYCRDQRSWVRVDLIGPDGRRWDGPRHYVPAGPERHENWAWGPPGGTAPGTMPAGLGEVLAAGGTLALQLEDEDGRVLDRHTIDSLTPGQRQSLLTANYKQVLAADPDMPVTEQMYEWQGPRSPLPVRPCPQT